MRLSGLLFALLGLAMMVSAEEKITRVSVLMSNHFDVGFDGLGKEPGFAINVIRRYIHKYIPEAVMTAEELRLLGGRERLIYTMEGLCPPSVVARRVKSKWTG